MKRTLDSLDRIDRDEDDEIRQRVLAGALEVASAINRHCATTEEVTKLLDRVSDVLSLRFTDFRISLLDTRK